MNRIIALVVAIVILAFVASSTVFVVDAWQTAVLSGRSGAPRLVGPGLHLKLPGPFEAATLIDMRIRTLDAGDPQTYTTVDKADVLASPIVKYRVTDALAYYRAADGDPGAVADRLGTALKDALAGVLAKRSLSDAIGAQQAIAGDAKTALETAAKPLGVDVVDLRLERLDLPAAAADAVYKRMSAEQTQLADEVRAQGAAHAEQIRADADRARAAILADAYKQAQTIKGAGDAKAASIAAEAFGRDPEFYQFYASLQAYRASFKPNDVIVVDPDSAFFRFMRSPSGGAAQPSAAPRKH